MKLIIAILLTLLIPGSIYSQDHTCESDFAWIKKTFEENDAGFQYTIDSKGQQAYDIHNTLMFEKIKSSKTSVECVNLLSEWLAFFRPGHLYVQLNQNIPGNQSENILTEKHETVDVDIDKFIQDIQGKKPSDFEGIWGMSNYVIGIKKENLSDYTGFVLESQYPEWKRGELKLKITADGKNLKSIFYLRNNTIQESNEVELIETHVLKMGADTLTRIQPKSSDVPSGGRSKQSVQNTGIPYIETLDQTTLLLRIPSFDLTMKPAIDKLLSENKSLILRTVNLIIDVRNNGGGADQSYREILPFLYTNPIRTAGVAYLSTKLNNQRMLRIANGAVPGASKEEMEMAQEAYKKLESHLNEFVDIQPNRMSINTMSTIYPFPKNVGIIINERNGSTTEQFLLVAKQSQKVKLFGTTTAGALDISNMYSVESPDKRLTLWYGLTKSHRLPGYAIDGKGIQPDYYIDSSIPQDKWVDFVRETYSQSQD